MFPSDLPSFFFQQIREAEERADKIYEPVIGVVVDNKDPDKLARIKVKFPSLPGDDSSKWAPIVALGAGADRGWFFLPEVDDEVLVMFEHGDFNRPVAIGAIWNGTDKPADKNDGANERRTIVSRCGSKIVFDDDKGTITLEDGGGEGTFTITTENKIIIESKSGDVCAQAPAGDVNVVANEIKLEADSSLKCEAATASPSGFLNAGADGKVTFKGDSMLDVSGMLVNLGCGSAQAA